MSMKVRRQSSYRSEPTFKDKELVYLCDVKKHFGIDWIKAHKHLLSRNYADSAQDRYHSKKWDDFMVL